MVAELSLIAFAVAFAAGVVSFASPCVLALVPGYLSFVSGVSFDRLGASPRQVTPPTLAFVGGFSLVFTAFGASAGLLGYSLVRAQPQLSWIAGGLLIAMGMAMVAPPRLGLLQRPRGPRLARRPTTLAGAGLAGGAFAVAWTPCIGPILGSILTAAAPTGSPALGASLLLTYSVGMGIPFLLAGLAVGRTMSIFRWLRDRWRVVQATAATVMVAAGVLVATGRLGVLTARLAEVGFQGL
jgi:cytochrome c-type biogenesis protein